MHEAAQDPVLDAFLAAYHEREVVPSFAPPDGADLSDYGRTVRERFASPTVRDSLERICAQTSDRIPTFVLPVVRDRLDADGDVRLAALVVASWARYAEGVDEDGRPIDVVDSTARRARGGRPRPGRRPDGVPAGPRACSATSSSTQRFVAAYVDALEGLHSDGARRTSERVVAESA